MQCCYGKERAKKKGNKKEAVNNDERTKERSNERTNVAVVSHFYHDPVWGIISEQRLNDFYSVLWGMTFINFRWQSRLLRRRRRLEGWPHRRDAPFAQVCSCAPMPEHKILFKYPRRSLPMKPVWSPPRDCRINPWPVIRNKKSHVKLRGVKG